MFNNAKLPDGISERRELKRIAKAISGDRFGLASMLTRTGYALELNAV